MFKLKSPVRPILELHRGREVINLSNKFSPTENQLKLLNKGLTFIPTPKINRDTKNQLSVDLQNYHRRLLLTTYFRHQEEKQILPFTYRSTWTPKLIQVPDNIRKIIRADKYALKNLPFDANRPPNLNKREKEALIQLSKNKDIVIKPADKGSATVIMDRDAYIHEAHRQLNQNEYYKKLEGPIFPETITKIKQIILNLSEKKFINKKQITYLIPPDEPRARRFYLLPKVHKNPESWSIPYRMPPGRPIVSDCESDTYASAEYIEHFLNPISTKHPSYIKDTYHFIDKVRKMKLPGECLLFTIDIDSLYTNIETAAGLTAVQEFFTRYPDKNRPDRELLKLLEINLTKNDFEFNSEWFLQVKGTAMGKKFAPSYANIYMAKWEEGALAAWPLKPLQYWRFLDDIWGVWPGTEAQFTDFAEHLNNFHKSIKIKYTLNHSEVNFLDIITYKDRDFGETGQLQTRVFFKETDTHALLHGSSFHPRHTFKGIIKSQLVRFHRISSQPGGFREATKTLFGTLVGRGYSRSFLRHCLRGFLAGGGEILEPRTKINIIPFVSTFSDYSLKLNKRVKENFDKFIAQGTVLRDYKVISAYKRNKNLKDILVKSKLYQVPINNPKIQAIKEFEPKRFITNPKTKLVFKVWPSLSEHISNCVYLIYCTKCHAQYVGETKNSLRSRLYQHRHNIKKKNEAHRCIVQHFLKHGMEAFRVMGLQHCPFWTDSNRKKCEGEWITKLDSKQPWGLNER